MSVAERIHPPVRGAGVSARRWAFAAAGGAAFVLAFIGAILPGMPTTVFLLIGSYCMTRACPWLERRVMSSRVFRPYAEFVHSTRPMSRRARWTALGMMTASVACSGGVLLAADRLTPVIGGVIGGLWLIGVVAIVRFRRAGGAQRG